MFTENQVRQLYVVSNVSTDTDLSKLTTGEVKVGSNADDDLYFNYKGPTDDGLQRSDLIPIRNIISVNQTAAADDVHAPEKATITLSDDVNDGKPVAGETYVLNVDISGFAYLGGNDVYRTFGVCRATSSDEASDIYKKLAISLYKNLNYKGNELISISLKDIEDYTITRYSKLSDSGLSNATATGIILEEKQQSWERGVSPEAYITFEAIPGIINDGSTYVTWGEVEYSIDTTNTWPNSRRIADMEWYFHKNRGDIYGLVNYPYHINTIYQVDPDEEDGYDVLDIHYYATTSNEGAQLSEKTITFVGKNSNITSLYAAVKSKCTANTLIKFAQSTSVTTTSSSEETEEEE